MSNFLGFVDGDSKINVLGVLNNGGVYINYLFICIEERIIRVIRVNGCIGLDKFYLFVGYINICIVVACGI